VEVHLGVVAEVEFEGRAGCVGRGCCDVEATGGEADGRALHEDGSEDDEEDDLEDVLRGGGVLDEGEGGEDDRGRTSETDL